MATTSFDEPGSDITRLLQDWRNGEPGALERLTPLVYDELHLIAARQMSREWRVTMYQTTALVSEAYLKLMGQRSVDWQNRAHFFAIAAHLMRRILVDNARRELRPKHGAGVRGVELEEASAVMVGLLAVVGVLAAGVATTLWQARQARAERERAERQFAAVRTLGASVLGELHDAVSGLKGSLGAREMLLRRATEYLDALAREAGDNVALRREVADGYGRLGQIQGMAGIENLGDRVAAKRSYENALLLLDPLAARTDPDPQDVLGVTNARLRLAGLTEDPEQRAHVERARAVLEGLPPDVRARPQSLSLESALWDQLALQHVRAKDYPKLRDARRNQLRVAEAVWRGAPDDLSADRNVSLACKQLGAVLQILESPAEARALFDRALALDQARVERDPARGLWRLDLSFSLGSIGALLQGSGDLDGALAYYQRAVELRRAVVAAEPKDDFARGSLVRGYQASRDDRRASRPARRVARVARRGRGAVSRAAACPPRARPRVAGQRANGAWIDHGLSHAARDVEERVPRRSRASRPPRAGDRDACRNARALDEGAAGRPASCRGGRSPARRPSVAATRRHALSRARQHQRARACASTPADLVRRCTSVPSAFITKISVSPWVSGLNDVK